MKIEYRQLTPQELAKITSSRTAEFFLVYDIRDEKALRQSQRHRRYWGRRFTDIYVLDGVLVVLAFRSAGERWEPWEAVRKRWILDEVLGREAAA
jgi:hypothetical protein